jgi:LacI family transcriptional regulator
MRDVAQLAGVGLATVSRVVNEHPQVSADTAARVRAAIKQLDFQRDDLARSLRAGQRSSSLALLLGNLTNPFYASVAAGAVQTAQAHGYALVIGTVDEDPVVERRTIRDLLGRRIAGLVIVPDQGDHSYLSALHARGDAIPVVFADRPGQGFPADAVLIDNERGGYLATQHLLEHGHTRIAVLVAPAYYSTGRRLRGYRRALREAGVAAPPSLIVKLPGGTAADAERATDDLLAFEPTPTALFTTTNFLTEGALRSMRRHDRSLALVGFDDFRAADLLPIPTTVVSVDAEQIGQTAMTMLLERLDDPDMPPRRLVLPPRLIARGSGECASSQASGPRRRGAAASRRKH